MLLVSGPFVLFNRPVEMCFILNLSFLWPIATSYTKKAKTIFNLIGKKLLPC